MKTPPAQILVAEHDIAWGHTLVRWLHAQGYRTCLATNGCEVLTLLLHHQFDGMLIDLELPTINGLDVTHAVRRNEVGDPEHMVVIGLAQSWSEVDSEVVQFCGLDGTLRRPFTEVELQQAMNSLALAA